MPPAVSVYVCLRLPMDSYMRAASAAAAAAALYWCTASAVYWCSTGAVAALLLQYARHLGIPSSNVAILGSVPVHNVGDDATVVDEDCGIAGNAT